jgi:hypothetical protein
MRYQGLPVNRRNWRNDSGLVNSGLQVDNLRRIHCETWVHAPRESAERGDDPSRRVQMRGPVGSDRPPQDLPASPPVDQRSHSSPRSANRRVHVGSPVFAKLSPSPRFPARSAVRVGFRREDGGHGLHVPERRWYLEANLSSPLRINSSARVSGPQEPFVSLGEPDFGSTNFQPRFR